MSPVTPIAHLLAVAAGLWGGLWLMDGLAPNLPDPDTAPAVASEIAPEGVAGDDPASLFRSARLAGALEQLSQQMAAGDKVVQIHLDPGNLRAETGNGGLELDTDEIEPNAPERIVAVIAGERPGVGLEDVQFMDLYQGPRGRIWYVQLDNEIDPPRTYTAPLEGNPVKPGGTPPP